MVSWGKSFETAVKIILMSIVWYVIGFCIAFIIITLAGGLEGLVLLLNPGLVTNPSQLLGLIGRLIAAFFFAMIVGGTISALGGMATLLKYSAELIADEVAVTSTLHLSPQGPPTSAPSQSSKFCHTCGAQSFVTAKFCSSCGTRLQHNP
jgi:hypothetical protein